MTDQEILNRIDAEIAEAEAIAKSGSVEFYFESVRYVNGLKFARALIVKRKEEVAF
jgi:hypothetical protein